MDENNNNSNTPNPQNDFDLDAALEEKFQQVQQDLDRLRAMPKRRYRKLQQRQIRRRTKNPPESGRLAIN